MKFILAAILCGMQTLAAPALAAPLPGDGAPQMGAFAGARLRVPLGGGRERPQAGLALTSTLRGGPTGELRFAKGAELGFSGSDRVRLSLAGRSVSQLAPGRAGPNGQKLGFSTVGWVIIGASAAIIVGGVLIFDYLGDQSE
jgi:hypothetical protein